jgi:hypothetical protein
MQEQGVMLKVGTYMMKYVEKGERMITKNGSGVAINLEV